MPSSIDIQSVSGPIKAELPVPGSKSDTNRALIAAALADGASVLHGALFSDDTRYMMSALRTLGFPVDADEQLHTIPLPVSVVVFRYRRRIYSWVIRAPPYGFWPPSLRLGGDDTALTG